MASPATDKTASISRAVRMIRLVMVALQVALLSTKANQRRRVCAPPHD
jgi:uncharacterized membrane protein YadS